MKRTFQPSKRKRQKHTVSVNVCLLKTAVVSLLAVVVKDAQF
jgi:hypothetical protein